MLAVSQPLGNNDHHQYHIHEQIQEENMESFGFHDFCNGNSLLDSIDFDDLFLGIHEDDVLPDLEMDPELLAEFSLTRNEESGTLNSSISVDDQKLCTNGARDDDKVSGLSASENNSDQCLNGRGDEVVSKMEDSVVTPARKEAANPSKGKKWKMMGQCKNSDKAQGKRKVKKVDWTPELHRKFVQAVEQLGVDKAVPSRILELMGIDCLTRHNIASHLQKYRSHRKHLLAREAEAASWSQRRQMYGAVPVAAAVASGGGSKTRDGISPWIAPVVPATLGCFPPVTPMPHFRPLHVWGHPTTDQSRVINMWQKNHPPPSTPPPAWPPAVPAPQHHLPPESLYWPHPHPHQPVANVASAGTVACFAQPLIPPPTRFGAPPGIPPHHPPMYKVKPIITTSFGPAHQFPLDLHPSKESIDAAIGDVLSKPWLPMPLGLKPPSVDGVMGELHRQGVPNIPPPSCA